MTGGFSHVEAMELDENSFGVVWGTRASLEGVWERERMSESVSIDSSPEMYYEGEQRDGASGKVVRSCHF